MTASSFEAPPKFGRKPGGGGKNNGRFATSFRAFDLLTPPGKKYNNHISSSVPILLKPTGKKHILKQKSEKPPGKTKWKWPAPHKTCQSVVSPLPAPRGSAGAGRRARLRRRATGNEAAQSLQVCEFGGTPHTQIERLSMAYTYLHLNSKDGSCKGPSKKPSSWVSVFYVQVSSPQADWLGALPARVGGSPVRDPPRVKP